jgi:hypothetical protein
MPKTCKRKTKRFLKKIKNGGKGIRSFRTTINLSKLSPYLTGKIPNRHGQRDVPPRLEKNKAELGFFQIFKDRGILRGSGLN